MPIRDKTGYEGTNNEGCRFKVIAYRKFIDCDIQFEDGTILKNQQFDNVKRGTVKNPFHKSVYGVGYYGIGKYKARCGDTTNFYYRAWSGTIRRCYDEAHRAKYIAYEGCSVSEQWHNFQNFAAWHEENYINGFHLDKDILVKGNKIYSPETCCFVPVEINSLFTNRKNHRGEYPLGVLKRKNRFGASIFKNGKQISLGSFLTVKEAFEAYKTAKETYIKEVADKWRGQITEQVYQALVNYKVEITD